MAGSTSGSLAGSLSGSLAKAVGAAVDTTLLSIIYGSAVKVGLLGVPADITISTGVSKWENSVTPGTHDPIQGTADDQPAFTAVNAAYDNRATVEPDGVNDYLDVSDMTLSTNDRVGMQSLHAFDDVTDQSSSEAFSIKNAGTTVFIMNGRILTTGLDDEYQSRAILSDGGVLEAYETPEASADTAPHLHESHCYAAGYEARFDGTQHNDDIGAEVGGISGAMTQMSVGARAGGSTFSNSTITECVLTVGATAAQAAAYRTDRIAVLYPTTVTLP